MKDKQRPVEPAQATLSHPICPNHSGTLRTYLDRVCCQVMMPQATWGSLQVGPSTSPQG